MAEDPEQLKRQIAELQARLAQAESGGAVTVHGSGNATASDGSPPMPMDRESPDAKRLYFLFTGSCVKDVRAPRGVAKTPASVLLVDEAR